MSNIRKSHWSQLTQHPVRFCGNLQRTAITVDVVGTFARHFWSETFGLERGFTRQKKSKKMSQKSHNPNVTKKSQIVPQNVTLLSLWACHICEAQLWNPSDVKTGTAEWVRETQEKFVKSELFTDNCNEYCFSSLWSNNYGMYSSIIGKTLWTATYTTHHGGEAAFSLPNSRFAFAWISQEKALWYTMNFLAQFCFNLFQTHFSREQWFGWAASENKLWYCGPLDSFKLIWLRWKWTGTCHFTPRTSIVCVTTLWHKHVYASLSPFALFKFGT